MAMQINETSESGEKKICLLDLNYTLVGNQQATKHLRPFSKRMDAEEYRLDLIEAVKDDYVIIITARPERQMEETLANIKKKTGWEPQEYYFNDIDADPPTFKESALLRFVFPKHGESPEQYYAVESNSKTRAMYKRYGIKASPYDIFIKDCPKQTENRELVPEQMATDDRLEEN